MATHAQGKRKGFTFTVDDDQRDAILGRMAEHGMDRNEYLWALVEADSALPLAIDIHPQTKARVLRPMRNWLNQKAAEPPQSPYGTKIAGHEDTPPKRKRKQA
jgi:hypothetical protein